MPVLVVIYIVTKLRSWLL